MKIQLTYVQFVSLMHSEGCRFSESTLRALFDYYSENPDDVTAADIADTWGEWGNHIAAAEALGFVADEDAEDNSERATEFLEASGLTYCFTDDCGFVMKRFAI